MINLLKSPWGHGALRTIVCFFVFNILTFHLFRNHDKIRVLRDLARNRVADAQEVLSRPVHVMDWGKMGIKVAAMTKLAEFYVENPKLDRKPLNKMLEKEFPWWAQTRPIFTPWANKSSLHPFTSSRRPPYKTAITMCVGKDNVVMATHFIVTLRSVLNSKLPIEVAYAGNSDLPLRQREFLRSLAPDIYLLNLLETFDDEFAGLSRGGWAMKPFAMLASRAPRVILVDADSIFLTTPDYLFDTDPGLIATGILFFHDRFLRAFDTSRQDWLRGMLKDAGRVPSATINSTFFLSHQLNHEAESGVVCMDKSRAPVFLSLMFSSWMNLQSVRDKVTYRIVHGDKETYWLAAELAGVPYHFQHGYAGLIGVAMDKKEAEVKKKKEEQEEKERKEKEEKEKKEKEAKEELAKKEKEWKEKALKDMNEKIENMKKAEEEKEKKEKEKEKQREKEEKKEKEDKEKQEKAEKEKEEKEKQEKTEKEKEGEEGKQGKEGKDEKEEKKQEEETERGKDAKNEEKEAEESQDDDEKSKNSKDKDRKNRKHKNKDGASEKNEDDGETTKSQEDMDHDDKSKSDDNDKKDTKEKSDKENNEEKNEKAHNEGHTTTDKAEGNDNGNDS